MIVEFPYECQFEETELDLDVSSFIDMSHGQNQPADGPFLS